ncbi:MAG: M23 family metallopeptidase [Clostridia bacterium]|nr:M23 family metallopeptidase [Clostridia bacterium]
MIIALFIIIAILLIKFQPAYKVTIAGEEVGYVKSAKNFKKIINEEVLNTENNEAAIVEIEAMPDYKFELVSENETNEDEIVEYVKQTAEVTYKIYEVSVGGQEPTYINTLEEAEEVVSEVKEKYEEDMELDIAIKEIYTTDIENIENSDKEVAKATIDNEIRVKIEEDEKKEKATVNGIYLASKPTSGNITSRFGSKESIRKKAHKGLDIASPVGTPIYAAADGKVIFASYSGGYGNVVKVAHGNNVETYYAHCSKLCVKVGENVKAGELIAKMGSTGRSTGSHLHFEVRVNGTAVNPQKFMY